MTESSSVREDADRAAEWVASRTTLRPRLGLVLGSGLSGAVILGEPDLEAGFDDVPGLVGPSVPGHPGRLIVGVLHQLPIVIFEGRAHLYEGLGNKAVKFNAALMARIGVRGVLLTSACGGLSPTLEVGDFVVVWDHLVYPLGGAVSALGRAEWPLGGDRAGEERCGPGSAVTRRAGPGVRGYSRRLSRALEKACVECRARWSRGVFGYSIGPCYETPAEARALRAAGADVVSMSAAADSLAAVEEGLEVACLCCVTNAVGLWRQARSGHDNVLAAARSSASTMGAVLDRFVQLIALGGMV
jgi:purine-nucleoside phosphorylase